MFLEIMAPIYPICFTMTVCISNLAKCIVSVAGGATRAALTMHQARRNNMADVSAKDSSQVSSWNWRDGVREDERASSHLGVWKEAPECS